MVKMKPHNIIIAIISGLILAGNVKADTDRKDVMNEAFQSQGAARVRRDTLARAISEGSKDTIIANEVISMNKFLQMFEKDMDPRSGLGDASLKYKLKETLYDFEHPYDNHYHNEFTRLSRMCRHLVEDSHIANRVRRTTGHLPFLVQEMGAACRDFQKEQTKENLDRLFDLDAEILKEIICLERGVVLGPGGTCRSRLRVGRSVLMDDESSILSDEAELPDAEEVTEFNSHLTKYCHERNQYEPSRIRRASHAAAEFAADTLEYMNCLCDNRTNCGHLAKRAALSFGNDIGEVMALELNKQLNEGEQMEQVAETEFNGEDQELVTPGNVSYQEALMKMENLTTPHHRVKRFERPDVFDIPLAEFGKHVGCGIIIHKDIPVQTFTCVFFKVLALELTFDWTNGLPWIEIVVKLCIPVVSDILDMIGKNFPPLASLLKMFDIEAGCFVVAKAYVDFYKGVFEIYSNVPQLSLIVVRAKLFSSFYIRFDPSRPRDDESQRNELNVYGYRKFMRLLVTFKAEYFEFWKLWMGSWQCIWCKNLADNRWPLGDDQSPLVRGTDPRPPPTDVRLVDGTVEGTGRIEVKPFEEWGTVCDDGWDVYEGDLICSYLRFNGYLGIWNETEPGSEDTNILLGGLDCKGTEEDLSKCPKTKDVGNTGCQHTEDVGIQCLTENSVCAEPLFEVYDVGTISHGSGSIQDTAVLFSDGGWSSDSSNDEWFMIDLWFSHRVSGVRTQGHAAEAAWTKKFRIEFSKDGEEWFSRQDGSGNEIMYTGNVDQKSIRSNFWYPPIPTRMLKLTSVEYEKKHAFRVEVHGCTGTDGIQEFADVIQSSTMFGGFAKLALDGKKDNNFVTGKSCSHTMEEINPWWAMDLGREMMLEGLLIINRGDCCGQRLSNFHVEVGHKISSVHGVSGELCYEFPGKMETNQRKIIRCQGTPRGRFVQVKKKGYGILTLCEIMIWAAPTVATCDLDGEKIDCGKATQEECETAGCCWHAGGSPKCYTFTTDVNDQSDDCADSLYNGEPSTKVTTSSHITDGGDFSYSRSRLDTRLNPDGKNNGKNYQHGGWCAAKNDKHQFIQVEFPDVWTVRKVVTQGADTSEDFVKQYRVYYSVDGNYWSTLGSILGGNVDVSTYAMNEFQRFSAKFIRINPTEWHGRICMRFDILGCKVCEVSLVQRDPVTFLSASSMLDGEPAHAPNRAKLDAMSGGSPYVEGGWTAGGAGIEEFLQIDFIGHRMISKVVTQGAYGKQQWVKRFSLEHSVTGVDYTSAGEFDGNTDNEGKVTNVLPKVVMARSVRIKVVEYFGKPTLRIDLLGCDPKVKLGIVEAAKENGLSEGISPAFFYISDTVTFDDAENKCKAFGARVSTLGDFTSALEGGFEVCSPGWISDGTVKQPQQHYTGADACGDPGDNDLGKPPANKLFGVFCAKPGAFVFMEKNDLIAICDDGSARLKCQMYGGRLLTGSEADAVREDGYINCHLGVVYNYVDDDPDTYNFNCEDSKQQYCSGLTNRFYCSMPALNSGIAPAGRLPYRFTTSGEAHYQRPPPVPEDGQPPRGNPYYEQEKNTIYMPVVNTNQFLFGGILGGAFYDIGAGIVGDTPLDSGVLTPPLRFEKLKSNNVVSFYRAVCPEGYVSLGDVTIPSGKEKDGDYPVNAKFRCISKDFVKQCKYSENYHTYTGGAFLYQVLPNRPATDLTARFYRVALSWNSFPPADIAFCMKRSHTVDTNPIIYTSFNPDVGTAELFLRITAAKSAILVGSNGRVTYFRPELEQGQYILGFVAVEGNVNSYTKNIYVATEQFSQDLLSQPDGIVARSPLEGFIKYGVFCKGGYAHVGEFILPDDEPLSEDLKNAYRCVRNDFAKFTNQAKWIGDYDVHVTGVENDMDFFESVNKKLMTLDKEKFQII